MRKEISAFFFFEIFFFSRTLIFKFLSSGFFKPFRSYEKCSLTKITINVGSVVTYINYLVGRHIDIKLDHEVALAFEIWH